jgi:hypothetical protein
MDRRSGINTALKSQKSALLGSRSHLKHNCPMPPRASFLRCIKNFLFRRVVPISEKRAYDLIVAIDAGGIPLNAGRVNAIARDLGQEVSTHAPVKDTIERIRVALKRARV